MTVDQLQKRLVELTPLLDKPEAWPGLDADAIGFLLLAKSMLYGVTQAGAMVPGLKLLYGMWMERCDPEDRAKLCLEVSQVIEQGRGQGCMAFMVFISDTPHHTSAAALRPRHLLPQRARGLAHSKSCRSHGAPREREAVWSAVASRA